MKPFDIRKARSVSLSELERATCRLPHFLFWGRADGFCYFGTPDGAVFRLPETVFELPPGRGWPLGKAAFYVTIRDGRIVAPSARRPD